MATETRVTEETIAVHQDAQIPANVPYGWTWGIVVQAWPEIRRLGVIAVLILLVVGLLWVVRMQNSEINALHQQIFELLMRTR
jgi:hypothetical protein